MGGTISNTSALPGEFRTWEGTRGNSHWEDLADTQHVSFFTRYGGKKNSVSADLFVNRAQNHYLYRDNIFERIRRKENNEVWDTGLRLSLVRELVNDAKLILSGDAYYGDKNLPLAGFSTQAAKQQDFSTVQNIMFDVPRFLHDALAMETSLSHSWRNRIYAPPSGASSHHDEHTLTLINRWNWYPRPEFTLRAGGDYSLAYLDSGDMGTRSRHDGGIYLTAEFLPHDSFLVVPSVKGVFSGPGSASPAILVPKLGFRWQASDALTVKNNYFRSFKHPDFEDLYWGDNGAYQGNPDLKPEDGWGGDLGLDYRYKNYLTLGSSFFAQWTRDSIHWASGPGGKWRPQNVGEAVFFGSENKVKILVFREVGISLSYQFLLGYLLSYGYTWESDKRIPYMPMHTLGLSLDIPWTIANGGRAGSLVISGHYETLRYADTANRTALDPYFLLNININQELTGNLAAFLTVNNALNSSYESFDSYPMPGVTFTLGMKINYPGNKAPEAGQE
jgi:vitamin B12 transporter